MWRWVRRWGFEVQKEGAGVLALPEVESAVWTWLMLQVSDGWWKKVADLLEIRNGQGGDMIFT